MNPVFAGAQARTAQAPEDGAESWSNPRQDGAVPEAKPQLTARDRVFERDRIQMGVVAGL
jgi:hypothetical protein